MDFSSIFASNFHNWLGPCYHGKYGTYYFYCSFQDAVRQNRSHQGSQFRGQARRNIRLSRQQRLGQNYHHSRPTRHLPANCWRAISRRQALFGIKRHQTRLSTRRARPLQKRAGYRHHDLFRPAQRHEPPRRPAKIAWFFEARWPARQSQNSPR